MADLALWAGLDVGQEQTHLCIIDQAGRTIHEDPDDIFSKAAIARIESSIPGGGRINPAVLEVTAGGYLEIKRRDGLVRGRGLRTGGG